MKSNIGISGKYRIKTFDSETGELKRTSDWIENLVVASAAHGLGLITSRLIGESTYDLEITQAKIGTGTNTPANTDTDLQTTTLANIPRATQNKTATSVTIEFFISSSDLANGTYTEFGLFCGNQLFARSIISPSYTKASSEDTGIEYTFTLTNT